MGPWMSFYDLHDALEQADCPVCRLTAVAAERYLKSLLWEHVNDPGVRDQVRRAQGFCREHAWALARPGAWLGVAILMRDVLQSVLSTMDTAHFRALPSLSLRRAQEYLDPAQPSAATADLVRRLRAGAKCPACIQVERMEAIYVETLVKNLLANMAYWRLTNHLTGCVCRTFARPWSACGTKRSSMLWSAPSDTSGSE